MSTAIKFSLFSHLSKFHDKSPLHPRIFKGKKPNFLFTHFSGSVLMVLPERNGYRYYWGAVKLMKWMQIVNGCVSFSVFLCRHFCRIAFLTPWPEFNLLTQWDALLGVLQLDHNGCNTNHFCRHREILQKPIIQPIRSPILVNFTPHNSSYFLGQKPKSSRSQNLENLCKKRHLTIFSFEFTTWGLI